MSLAACHTPADGFQFHLSLCIGMAVVPQPAFQAFLTRLPQSAYHFSRLRQIEVKPKIVHSLPDGMNLCLLIKCQLQFPLQKAFHLLQAFFQIISIRMNQYHIIHIPCIVFYPQFLFHQTVQPVQIIQSKPLAGLVAHGKSLA